MMNRTGLCGTFQCWAETTCRSSRLFVGNTSVPFEEEIEEENYVMRSYKSQEIYKLNTRNLSLEVDNCFDKSIEVFCMENNEEIYRELTNTSGAHRFSLPDAGPCSEDDNALQELSESLHREKWTQCSNIFQHPCQACDTTNYGIRCRTVNDTSYLEELRLGNLGIQGVLPIAILSKFTRMTFLDLISDHASPDANVFSLLPDVNCVNIPRCFEEGVTCLLEFPLCRPGVVNTTGTLKDELTVSQVIALYHSSIRIILSFGMFVVWVCLMISLFRKCLPRDDHKKNDEEKRWDYTPQKDEEEAKPIL